MIIRLLPLKKSIQWISRLNKVTLKTAKITKIGKQAFKGTKSNATYKIIALPSLFVY